MKLIECVPNFSNGNDPDIIAAIANAIQSVNNVSLLHTDYNAGANRSVFTFIGEPEKIIEAAFKAIKVASELIDMNIQKGVHPRLGACDVCPLIPLQNISIDEVVSYANILAEKVGKELSIPVYCYEYNSKHEYRRRLEQIRKGEYEGLKEKMLSPDWHPDFGPDQFNAKSGATIMGARNFLIAYNINLDTKNITIAKEIAALIRQSGRKYKDISGQTIHTPGLLKSVKAIAWYIEDFDKIQISTNITNFNDTSIFTLFETIKKLSGQNSISVTGSELVGLVPLQALLDSADSYLQQMNVEHTSVADKINFLVEQIGLNEIKSFDIKEQVIEYKAGIL